MGDQREALYPHALPAGAILNGRYILGQPLGQGGFGITYVAQDDQTGQKVAIKEFFPETMVTRSGSHLVIPFSGQRQENFAYGLQCFLSEARTLAQFIGTENIVGIHSYFEENGTAYFVMDYVEGISLQTYVKEQGGKISWEAAKKLLFPIMDALSIVHSKGIIHRDIAPDNIYIANDGGVKLLDFGAARYSLGDRSRSLDVVLKAGYAPKEQYSRRGRQGPYTDVYSLAATFYYALTGRAPSESIDRMEEDDLIPVSTLGAKVPAEAELALEKALAVQPGDRFSSMAEFKAVLDVQEEIPLFIPEFLPEPAPKPKSFRWLPVLLGMAMAAALGVGGILVFRNDRSQEAPKVMAQETTVTPVPELEETEDSSELRYQEAMALLEAESCREAYKLFKELGSYRDSQEQASAILRKLIQVQTIDADMNHTVCVKTDGSVVFSGHNWSGEGNVRDWTDIIAVSVGRQHTVGVRGDGTVTTAGNYGANNVRSQEEANAIQEEVSAWTDIVSVYAESYYTVGLRGDGTVVTAGLEDSIRQQMSEWTDIIAVSECDYFGSGISSILGLRADGTVVAAHWEEDAAYDFSGWTDIIALENGIGVRADGTLLTMQGDGELAQWSNIAAVSLGFGHAVGLRSDGTVVAAGNNRHGECNVSQWQDIVAVAAGANYTVGLQADGRIVGTGMVLYNTHWKDIRVPDER